MPSMRMQIFQHFFYNSLLFTCIIDRETARSTDLVYFKEEMKTLLPGWKSLVAESMKEELPVPAFSSALNYFYSLTSADLPANLVQAQRDYFGAHTFERKDELRGQFFHENWTGHGGDTKSGTYNV